MPIIVRIKQAENIVHEWLGTLSGTTDFAKAIETAVDEFRVKVPGFLPWGLTIIVDRYGGAR
jgi:hypothetical protein